MPGLCPGMANGPPGAPGAGMVETASRVITTLGFPVVVAAVLLWYLLTRFEHSMDTITSRMERNADTLQTFIAEMEAQTGELRAQTVELKTQTLAMSEQGKIMHQIANDAGSLVDIRTQELQLLQRLNQEHPAVKGRP